MQKRISGTLSVTAAALIFGLSGPAAAGFVSASSEATLAITGISSSTGGDTGDLKIIADDSFFIEDFFVIPPLGMADGNASAEAQVIGIDPFDLGLDEGVQQTSAASGFAIGKRPAAIDAFAFTSSIIEILNESATDLFSIDFLLSYTLSASTQGSGGTAIADINAGSGSGAFSLFEEVVTDANNGIFDTPVTNAIPFTLEVDQSGDLIFIDTNAEASARSVPLPSVLTLVLPGIFLAARLNRRRHSH
jgi:hypothetical protein